MRAVITKEGETMIIGLYVQGRADTMIEVSGSGLLVDVDIEIPHGQTEYHSRV
jgi:hypothetical protein